LQEESEPCPPPYCKVPNSINCISYAAFSQHFAESVDADRFKVRWLSRIAMRTTDAGAAPGRVNGG
jgi:hypothetical protein